MNNKNKKKAVLLKQEKNAKLTPVSVFHGTRIYEGAVTANLTVRATEYGLYQMLEQRQAELLECVANKRIWAEHEVLTHALSEVQAEKLRRKMKFDAPPVSEIRDAFFKAVRDKLELSYEVLSQEIERRDREYRPCAEIFTFGPQNV